MDNWNEIINQYDNARRWIGKVKAETEHIIAGFEKACVSDDAIYWHFDKVASKLVALEREVLVLWALDTGERLIPCYDTHYEFGGIYSDSPRMLGCCRTYPDNFRIIELFRNIMIAGNSELVINVLAHECLHAILDRDVKHGAKFTRAMEILNHALGLHICVRVSHYKAINRYRYVVYCPPLSQGH